MFSAACTASCCLFPVMFSYFCFCCPCCSACIILIAVCIFWGILSLHPPFLVNTLTCHRGFWKYWQDGPWVTVLTQNEMTPYDACLKVEPLTTFAWEAALVQVQTLMWHSRGRLCFLTRKIVLRMSFYSCCFLWRLKFCSRESSATYKTTALMRRKVNKALYSVLGLTDDHVLLRTGLGTG